jgi:hypothetical protein
MDNVGCDTAVCTALYIMQRFSDVLDTLGNDFNEELSNDNNDDTAAP